MNQLREAISLLPHVNKPSCPIKNDISNTPTNTNTYRAFSTTSKSPSYNSSLSCLAKRSNNSAGLRSSKQNASSYNLSSYCTPNLEVSSSALPENTNAAFRSTTTGNGQYAAVPAINLSAKKATSSSVTPPSSKDASSSYSLHSNPIQFYSPTNSFQLVGSRLQQPATATWLQQKPPGSRLQRPMIATTQPAASETIIKLTAPPNIASTIRSSITIIKTKQ